MSNNYLPLILPERGEDLLEGRQYILSPLARDMLYKVYNQRGVPQIIECIRRKVAKTRIATLTQTYGTDEKSGLEVIKSQQWHVLELDAQEATFRCSMGWYNPLVFCIDLEDMYDRASTYAETHVIPDSLVEEWSEYTKLRPLNEKIRGCTARWWQKGAIVPSISGRKKAGTKEEEKVKIDLSWLDSI